MPKNQNKVISQASNKITLKGNHYEYYHYIF